MPPVSTTLQHLSMLPSPSPSKRELCAGERRSQTCRHQSGLRAQNWTLTQPQGSKPGALGKNWVQYRKPRTLVCLQRGLAQCSGVGQSRTRLPGGSLGTGRYRSGAARNTNRMDSMNWSVRRDPG